jgi:hypothetical protein
MRCPGMAASLSATALIENVTVSDCEHRTWTERPVGVEPSQFVLASERDFALCSQIRGSKYQSGVEL